MSSDKLEKRLATRCSFGGGEGMPDMSGMDPKDLAKLAKQFK